MDEVSIQQGTAGGMPVLILKEGSSETKGKEVKRIILQLQKQLQK